LSKGHARSTEQVIEDIRHQVEITQPALVIDFGQVIGDMLGDLMESVQPVEIKIYGDNNEKLQELSRQVNDIVEKTQGTADVFYGIVISGPSVTVLPDNSALAQYGLTPLSFQTQLQLGLQGMVVSTVHEREQLSVVRMIYPGSTSRSVESIRQLPVFLPSGKLMPITNLAKISVNR